MEEDRAYLRRRIHEVELQQILHPERLQQQDSIGQVGSLDLWNRTCEHVVSIRHLGVQPVTKP